MSEFKPGEIALYFLGSGWEKRKHSPNLEGSECELVRFEVCSKDGPGWFCQFPGYQNPATSDGSWWVPVECLRKRPPTEQYKDQFTPASKDFNWREPVNEGIKVEF